MCGSGTRKSNRHIAAVLQTLNHAILLCHSATCCVILPRCCLFTQHGTCQHQTAFPEPTLKRQQSRDQAVEDVLAAPHAYKR